MFSADLIEPQPIEPQTEVLTLVYLWLLLQPYTLEDNTHPAAGKLLKPLNIRPATAFYAAEIRISLCVQRLNCGPADVIVSAPFPTPIHISYSITGCFIAFRENRCAANMLA